ncbi:MAG TPA: ATP-binding protein [Actinomycetota bacterium]
MRRRLVLGALYLLLVVVVGLTVPFGATLGNRLVDNLAGRVERESFGVAGAIEDTLETRAPDTLQPAIEHLARQIGGRILVTDASGILLADSLEPPGSSPPSYATRPEIRSALAGTPSWEVRTSTSLGEDILVSAVPVRSAERVLGVVRISYPMAEVRTAIRRSYLFLGLVGASTLVVGLLLAAWLARGIVRPLRNAARVARRITAGDLTARVPEGGPREVGELARDLNVMTERLGDLIRANREFAANASHQLRTPLAALRLNLEEALDGPDPHGEVRHALGQADRMADIVDALLALGPAGEQRIGSVDVEGMLRDLSGELATEGREIRVQGRGVVRADPARVRQVLGNLLHNALRFARRSIRASVHASEERIAIRIEDDGPGVSPEEGARVFDRFFRGRAPHGSGSGLGLAVARELASADGATIEVAGSDLGGACFEVSYPAARVEAPV